MKRLLCYGDSITWGCNPETGKRFDAQTRYPRVLGTLLGTAYDVIEEGCGGRTTVYDTDVDHYVNGRAYLYPCLESHQPLDLIVLMLGSEMCIRDSLQTARRKMPIMPLPVRSA